MKSCLTCGGAILEPNKSYGYAGQICYCQVKPRVQKPSDTFHTGSLSGVVSIDLAELMKLKQEITQLNAQLAEKDTRLQDLEWFQKEINKYVLPGDINTQDSALRIFKEQSAEIERLHENIEGYINRRNELKSQLDGNRTLYLELANKSEEQRALLSECLVVCEKIAETFHEPAEWPGDHHIKAINFAVDLLTKLKSALGAEENT